MVSFGENAKIKKVGNLNSGRSYVITTVFCVSLNPLMTSALLKSHGDLLNWNSNSNPFQAPC